MKSLWVCFFLVLSPLASAKVLANYTYLKTKKPVTKRDSIGGVKKVL